MASIMENSSLPLRFVQEHESLFSSIPEKLFTQSPLRICIYLFVSVAVMSLYYNSKTSDSLAFRDSHGKQMKSITSNTRFRRFTSGMELSEEGNKLANGAPYTIRNGSKTEVVLSTPTHMKDFYSGDARDHAKPPHMNMGHYFDRVLGVSVGVQSGDKWRTTRAHFDPSFSHLAATQFQRRFATEITKWLECLGDDAHVVAKSSDRFSIDAVQACRQLPFKLVACACYGDLLTDATFTELLRLNETHEKLMATTFFGSRTTSRLYGMLPFPETRAMDAYQKTWKSFNMRIIDAARMTGLNCPAQEIYKAVESGKINQAEYLQTVDEILFTNVDVTSAVLGFLLINLSANQGCQEDLRAEMLQHVEAPHKSSSITPDFETYLAQSNTLLEYTCMESVRLCPAAWFSLPEYSPNDKTIDGYRIPAGIPIIIDWKRLNTESPIWNPVPPSSTDKTSSEQTITGHTFEPRRFQKLNQSQYRYSLLRFGIGPRKCIGKNFAGIMTKLFLSLILPRYRLELDSGLDGEGEGIKFREDRFTVTPKQTVRFIRV